MVGRVAEGDLRQERRMRSTQFELDGVFIDRCDGVDSASVRDGIPIFIRIPEIPATSTRIEAESYKIGARSLGSGCGSRLSRRSGGRWSRRLSRCRGCFICGVVVATASCGDEGEYHQNPQRLEGCFHLRLSLSFS